MANEEQLAIINRSVDLWNDWRANHAHVRPDLRGADLRGADLQWADLSQADLSEADLVGVRLVGADLREADLYTTNACEANLREANLRGAGLVGADLSRAELVGAELVGAHMVRAIMVEAQLRRADLRGADLRGADLRGADLRGADLRHTLLVDTGLEYAKLSGSAVYGVSAWNVRLEGAEQADLSINQPDEPNITVDNLEVAQFLYLMLHNDKIRDVIDTLTSKVVLILGRFTPERKRVLDTLRDELRSRNYVPVLFDFEGPSSHNFTETVTLLARMARFIIADLTEPSSIPKELEAIVPHVHVPVQPLIAEGTRPYAMFADYRLYSWVLNTCRYASLDGLIASMGEDVIAPVEAKVIELRRLRQSDDGTAT